MNRDRSDQPTPLQDLDVVFACPDGHYAIGDPDNGSRESTGGFIPEPDIYGGFGTFHVVLGTPGEVTLRVRVLNEEQWASGAPPVPLPHPAVAANAARISGQGPMEVFAGGRSVGSVGGTAGSTYTAKWYCLSRKAGREEHLIGIYRVPQTEKEPAFASRSDDAESVMRLAATFENAGTPLIRTDFSSDTAWRRVVAAVTAPSNFNGSTDGGYEPNVTVFDEPAFEDLSGETLAALCAPHDELRGYVALADARSMAEASDGGDLTVDYVDLSVEDDEDAELFESFLGRTFRCATIEFASVEANLAIANMDFHEFADSVSADGVFRGFDPAQ
jgi:hypothetical protein